MSLQDFSTIGHGISLYEPQLNHEKTSDQHQTSGKSDAVAQPALIIMCTWLGGATDKRVQHYTQGYHRLWPQASILLIRTSNAEYAFYSTKYLRRKLRPAIHAIRRTNDKTFRRDSTSSSFSPSSAAAPSGTLLHIFSNGGAYVATQLVSSMNTILKSVGGHAGPPLPLRQIVFDSCPGAMTVDRGYQAAARALPVSPLRPLGQAALYLAVLGIVGSETVGFRKPLCEAVQEQLNDPGVFDPGAVRVYLSSTTDDIVYTEEALAHRDEAAIRGYRTETVLFNRAAHCALAREDEAKYWGTIASAWDKVGDPMAATSRPSIVPSSTAWRINGGRGRDVQPQRAVLFRSRL